MSRSDKSIQRRRIGISLLASVAVHALLVVLVSVAHHDRPLIKKKPPQIMDVVLLDSKQPSKIKPPEDAQTMSNRSAVGGSSKAQDRVTRAARAPVVGAQQQKPQRPVPPARPKHPPPAPEPQKRPRMLARRGPVPDNSKHPRPTKKQPPVPAAPRIPLSNLMPSTMALAQLSRDFQREKRLKQMLSREADIPINTREAKYAPYAQALVRALEEQWRPGKANYERFPEEARRSLMRITIEHNGELGGVEILRPSPIPQINESAVAAIHAAAPFRPLPSSWGLDRVSFYLTFEVVEDRFVFRTM